VRTLIDTLAFIRGLNIFDDNRINKPTLSNLVLSLEKIAPLKLKAIVCAPVNSGNIAFTRDSILPKARIEELLLSKLNTMPNIQVRARNIPRQSTPPFKHKVTTEMKREILDFRAYSPSIRQKPIVKLPLPEKIEDDEKVDVKFPRSKDIEDKIAELALELDAYGVQSCVRAQDYIKTFMRANAILNGRGKTAKSDLYLYDLIHPLFLNTMGEMGTENRLLTLIKNNPDAPDKDLMKVSGLSRGTFYKYKRILRAKGIIWSH